DLQVPAEENLSAIGSALKEGGNENVTLKELPGLNHLFQESATGSPSEYGAIEETFSPKALVVISDWISQQVE
ncbi:MAG: alpha/beta hydrolase, partial [Pricia sp.]